jgi:hypothetical protein
MIIEIIFVVKNAGKKIKDFLEFGTKTSLKRDKEYDKS